MAANSSTILTAIARGVHIFLVSSECLKVNFDNPIQFIDRTQLCKFEYNDSIRGCNAWSQRKGLKRKYSVICERDTLLQSKYSLYVLSKSYNFQYFGKFGENTKRVAENLIAWENWKIQCKHVHWRVLKRHWWFRTLVNTWFRVQFGINKHR